MSHHRHQHQHQQERTVRQLLRDLRSATLVAVSPATRDDERRARTIARMAELQALGRAERSSAFRRWRAALIGLAALVPAAASAAWLVRAERSEEPSTGSGAPLSRAVTGAGQAPRSHAADPAALPSVAGAAAEPGVAEEAPSQAHETLAPSVAEVGGRPVQPSARGSGAPSRSGVEASTLSEENALLQSAMDARRRGQAARAVELLDELLRRFPHTPLRTGAEVERFRALEQAGRKEDAVRAARRYLASHPEGVASEEARALAVEPVKGRPTPVETQRP